MATLAHIKLGKNVEKVFRDTLLELVRDLGVRAKLSLGPRSAFNDAANKLVNFWRCETSQGILRSPMREGMKRD